MYKEYWGVCGNWVPPAPPPHASVSPPWNQRGVATPPCVEGVGGPNSTDWIESLALCIFCDSESSPIYCNKNPALLYMDTFTSQQPPPHHTRDGGGDAKLERMPLNQWWAKLLRLLTVNSLSYFVKIKY